MTGLAAQLAAVGDTQLLHSPVKMRFDRSHRQDEPFGDLDVGQSLGGELGELLFAGSERHRGMVEFGYPRCRGAVAAAV